LLLRAPKYYGPKECYEGALFCYGQGGCAHTSESPLHLKGSILFAELLFVFVVYGISENKHMQKEVIEKVSALVTAAFGLVAALAWNTAIQEIFRLIFGDQSGVWAMIFYAVVVTIIAVVVTILVGRAAQKAGAKKPEGS
jgi:ABC-type Mn2+/Zn2+ transport system permease subunit